MLKRSQSESHETKHTHTLTEQYGVHSPNKLIKNVQKEKDVFPLYFFHNYPKS